jgi:hypothetical protein
MAMGWRGHVGMIDVPNLMRSVTMAAAAGRRRVDAGAAHRQPHGGDPHRLRAFR